MRSKDGKTVFFFKCFMFQEMFYVFVLYVNVSPMSNARNDIFIL